MDDDLVALGSQHPDRWESYVVRPWHVVDEPPRISHFVSNSYIFRPELGAATADAALNGDAERGIGNEALRVKGQAALKARAAL